MTPEELLAQIRQTIPDAELLTKDLTGTQDHWQLTVISRLFEGKRLLQQHRMVKEALAARFEDGTIHALTLKTYTPARWSEETASGDVC